uniref:histidine phosphatase family protein n=1 Tax=Streptomyces griseoruber TaxID=1943 RepID=UPI000A52F484
MRLLLVRHGQTPTNVDHLLDTAVPGPGLTALGEQQAAALVDALAGEDLDALYASTLVRTQLTAAPLAAARGLDVHVRDGIREVFAGDLEMQAGESAHAALYMRTVFAWAAALAARYAQAQVAGGPGEHRAHVERGVRGLAGLHLKLAGEDLADAV